MTSRRLAAAALALGLGVIAGAAPAHAGDARQGSAGTRLTFIGSDAKLGINDNGTPGSSAGDVRTLSLTLSTKRGAVVGSVDVVQTLTDEARVDRAVKVVVISLPKGIITAQGLTTFADFSNAASRPNDRIEQLAIVGGTGAYRGASGILDIVVLPGFTSRWIVDLD